MRREADGSWGCRLYLGTARGGRRLRPYRRFDGSLPEAEAQRLADEWADSLTAAGRPAMRRLPDALDAYVASMASRGASPNTVRNYRWCAAEAAALLGRVPTPDLGPVDVDEAECALLSGGGRSGRALSRSTVRLFHWFLAGAYDWLCAMGCAAANPVRSVSAPTSEPREAVALDAGSLAALQARLAADFPLPGAEPADALACVLAACDWVALHAGLRVGEVCALRPRDLVAGGLRVAGTAYEGHGGTRRRATTKGKRVRVVALTPAESAALSALAAWQRRRLGSLPADGPLLTPDGRWLAPSAVSGSFSALARELGLPEGTRFHTLRHTHASWLLASGVDMRTVSERLGHADVALTMRTYAHMLPGRDRAAAEAIARALGGCARGVPGGPPGLGS